MKTEIGILTRLKHPHIVQLFVCIDTPTYIYLVMEYCQLSDLAQFMKKRHSLPSFPETADIFRKYPNPESGGLNEVLTRHFVKQIVCALQYLRSNNLIHRDIKPQNLLLNPAPTYMSKQKPEDIPLAASENSLIPAVGVASLPMLKIADFGFARHLPSTSMAETLCGSPLYMAPEILRYEKYDARADLWSTGTVLHEMVVGKPPFRAQNHVDLLRKIEKANDVIPFDNRTMTISRGMKDLIRKLLKKSPLERITYEDLFNDPVITGEIPGLVAEDKPAERTPLRLESRPVPEVSELTRKMTKMTEATGSSGTPPESRVPSRASQDEGSKRSARETADQQSLAEDSGRRRSSSGGNATGGMAPEIKRQSSHREREQRRPSIVAHVTAPGRQELLHGQVPLATAAPRMERRPSRSSPLAGPPLVREPTMETDRAKEDRVTREARERTAQDLTFEKEYVVIEKRAVEVNAFADELDANTRLHGHGSPYNQPPMARRATTQGQPTSTTGAQPANPSNAMQMVTGRAALPNHQRAASFERRYSPSPQSATNMLTKALNAANVRLFGALGTSPPFGKGPSPPHGYGAFPVYPTPSGTLTIGDTSEAKTPMDEDSRLIRTMEDAAHRSDVIYGFVEVKYRQLLPATPSSQDALGIQQIGAQRHNIPGSNDDEEEDEEQMTKYAIVGVAEEALVLYVKALAILTKTIDLAGYWWNKQNRGEGVASDASPASASNVGMRILAVVKWSRARFNECLEKSEVVGRKLQSAQRQLPEGHPGHPRNQTTKTGSGGAVTMSAEHIQITSGVTAEKLMFERAVEMSRAAAISELVGEEMNDCELGYKTAIMLFEAVLEIDDEPLMRKPSTKKERPTDEIINGMEKEDRQMVIKRKLKCVWLCSDLF